MVTNNNINIGKVDKIKWNKVGKFVVFKGKKFYFPYQCLCCGKIISEEQFCFGRCCAYCDVGSCGGREKGHGRKDILENAEDLGDEFEEVIKEKLKIIRKNKNG